MIYNRSFNTRYNIAATYAISHCCIHQVLALKTGSSTVVLVKELGLMLELPRILLNMYQVYILHPAHVFIVELLLRLPLQRATRT